MIIQFQTMVLDSAADNAVPDNDAGFSN